VGKVFTVSKARVQPKRAAYNNTNSDYEITLDRNSVVQVRPPSHRCCVAMWLVVPVCTGVRNMPWAPI
jgi:hypothetical protein